MEKMIEKKNMDKFLNQVLLVVPVFIAILLWCFVSFKCCLLFYGIFSLGMYIHITITTLSNVFIGREVNMVGDVFWKISFLIISCLCLSIFYVL